LIFSLILLTLALILSAPSEVLADMSQPEITANQALCLPGYDGSETPGCLDAGPSARLQELAQQGITFPAEPIYAGYVPYELSIIPFSYALADSGVIPVYATLDDVANNHPTGSIPAGRIKYVSLLNRADTDKGRFYQIATTEW
jgi:hypothetical protein